MDIFERRRVTLLRLIAIVTMGAGLFFLIPSLTLRTLGVGVADDTGLFFVRHWGLVVCALGYLLYYSAKHRDHRAPVIFVVTAEKLTLVLMLAVNWSNPDFQGLRPAALIDGFSVLVLSLILLRDRRSV